MNESENGSGNRSGTAPHVMIVEARFYDDIADALVQGATKALAEAGATFDRFAVPGTFEIPAAISMAARRRFRRWGRDASGDGVPVIPPDMPPRYDGYIALGCVIRGETSHYDYVCGESARGLMDLSVRRGLAIGFGILTCENRDQAWARAAVDQGNKGADAARAGLAMMALRRTLDPRLRSGMSRNKEGVPVRSGR